jgi:hypothetical protein
MLIPPSMLSPTTPNRLLFIDNMKLRHLLAVVLIYLPAGCARIVTDQTDTTTTKPDGTRIRTVSTRAAGGTFLASKQHLDKLRTTQTDKTQGMSVGAIDQETDTAPLAKAIAEGATAAAIKAVKP